MCAVFMYMFEREGVFKWVSVCSIGYEHNISNVVKCMYSHDTLHTGRYQLRTIKNLKFLSRFTFMRDH